MKVIPFHKNNKNFQTKIDKIEKFAKYEKFWFDFDNNRRCTKQDYHDFIAKIYPKAHYIFNGHEGVKKNGIYFWTYWKLPFYLIGKDSSPRQIMMYMFNNSLVNTFKNSESEKNIVQIANIIYDSFFTGHRLSEFKKFKIVSS